MHTNKNMLHTSCTALAHFMQKLFVPRHALETDFRATACLEEILPSKTAVLPCKFGHILYVSFPCF